MLHGMLALGSAANLAACDLYFFAVIVSQDGCHRGDIL